MGRTGSRCPAPASLNGATCERLGLLLMPETYIVLLDKCAASNLSSVFERATDGDSWKSPLQGIAGVNKALSLLPVREFVKGP